MSIYEHTYIATPDCNKKDIDNIEKKIESILTSNAGKIVRKEDWGLRNLAYPIKKNVKGIYQNLYFESNGKAIKEIEYFSISLSSYFLFCKYAFATLDLSDFIDSKK